MWKIPAYLYLLSLTILSNAQLHGGLPKPPGGLPTKPDPKSEPARPAGPEFKDVAQEKLLLRPLADGKVSAHFEFEYLNRFGVPRDPRTLGSEDDAQHYEFFPLSLGQILREYAVAEMHLSLNSGRWRYDAWGYPENPAVGSGAELWAWMADGGPVSVEERWTGLSNALAGVFCASLSALPQSRTTSPSYTFSPEGQLPLYPIDASSDHQSPITPIQNTTSGLPYKLYHAILPSENICTENLTPFIKVLPCKNYAGIAELLNPHKLFGGWWYGVGVHATWHDGKQHEVEGIEEPVHGVGAMGSKARAGKFDGKFDKGNKVAPASEKEASSKDTTSDILNQKQVQKAGVRLRLTVGAVLDADSQARRVNADTARWSLETVFGKNITALCAVTNRADVRLLSLNPPPQNAAKEATDTESAWKLTSEPPVEARRKVEGSWTIADVNGENGEGRRLSIGPDVWNVVKVKKDGLNLTVTEHDLKHRDKQVASASTPFTLTRSLRGSDQTRGGFSISITNHLATQVDAWYVESVPWILRPYLSSLRIEDVQRLDQPKLGQSQQALNEQNNLPISTAGILDFQNVNYAPPSSLNTTKETRAMPTLLEIPLRLPPRSIVSLSFEFEKVFLKYTEHPPDAQRGWDLPGGLLVPVESMVPGEMSAGDVESPNGRVMRMYTAPLLADLATPDFSMPYNVIILSGALIALLFGMLFNMLIRQFVLVKV